MTVSKEEFEAVYASLSWLYKRGDYTLDEFHTELVELVEEYVGSEE